MRRGEFFWGSLLVILGVLFLLKATHYITGNVLDLCWPAVIIAIGIWILSGIVAQVNFNRIEKRSTPLQDAKETHHQPNPRRHHQSNPLRYLWRSGDVWRRILITLLIVFGHRFLLHIPLPGISITPDAIRENIVPGSGLNTLIDFLGMLSGSSLLSVSVLALGLLPFNLTGLLLEMSILLIPSLRKNFEKDPYEGRRLFEKLNYYLAIPMAAIESLVLLFLIAPNCGGRLILLEAGNAQTGILFTTTTMVILIAGSFFTAWLAGLISEFGIRGQGSNIIIMTGIIGQMPNEFLRLLKTQINTTAIIEGTKDIQVVPQMTQSILLFLTAPSTVARLLLYVILFILCILVVIYIQSGRRIVHVIYPSRQLAYLYKSLSPVRGELPLTLMIGSNGLISSQIFVALTTFYAPLISCSNIYWLNISALWIIDMFGKRSPYFGPIAFASVAIFTFFYANRNSQRKNYGENLLRTGAIIPNINNSAVMIQNYLTAINRRITFPVALGLGFLAIVPWLFNYSFGVDLDLLEAEKLIIIVSVIRDVFVNTKTELEFIRGYDSQLVR
ncbi:MAG: LiaI-LiaF-like domain-containing protein [Chloroflexota bacterium]